MLSFEGYFEEKTSEELADLEDLAPTYKDNGTYMPEAFNDQDTVHDNRRDSTEIWRDYDSALFLRAKAAAEETLDLAQYAGPAALAGGAVLGATMLADRGIEKKEERTSAGRRNIDTAVNTAAVLVPWLAPGVREPGYYKDRQENMRVEPLLDAMDSDQAMRDAFVRRGHTVPEVQPRAATSALSGDARLMYDPMLPVQSVTDTVNDLSGEPSVRKQERSIGPRTGYLSYGVYEDGNEIRPGLIADRATVAHSLASKARSDDTLSRMLQSKAYGGALRGAGIASYGGLGVSLLNNKFDVLTPEQTQYVNYLGYGAAGVMAPHVVQELRRIRLAHDVLAETGGGSVRNSIARAAMAASPMALPFITPHLSSAISDQAGYK